RAVAEPAQVPRSEVRAGGCPLRSPVLADVLLCKFVTSAKAVHDLARRKPDLDNEHRTALPCQVVPAGQQLLLFLQEARPFQASDQWALAAQRGDDMVALPQPLPIVAEPHLVPENCQAWVIVEGQALDVMPTAGVRPEQFTAVEDVLDNRQGDGLSSE